MNDKKSPHQDLVNDYPSDDDMIIELTDEVEPQTKKNSAISPDESPALQLDKEFPNPDAASSLRSEADRSPIADNSELDEDEIIASAIEESLGSDGGDTISLAEEIKPLAEPDGPILSMEEASGDPDHFDSGREAALEMENERHPLDPEEEIDLEFEEDETETDLFALEDQHPLEFDVAEDLPDLASQIEIDLDDDDNEQDADPSQVDDGQSGSDADIPAPLAADSLMDQQATEEAIQDTVGFDFADDQADEFEPALEKPDDDASSTDPLRQQLDLLETEPEETLEFEHAENLSQPDDGFDFKTHEEEEDSVIPLNGLVDASVQPDEDITEITEFDEYFPADDETPTDAAEVLNLSDDQENDFIELIDVEEDAAVNDEEIIDFKDPQTELVDDDVNRFFSEAIEQEAAFDKQETSSFDDLADEPGPTDTFVPGTLDSEPAVATLPTEQTADELNSIEPHSDDQPPEPLPEVPTSDQIEAAVERLIDQKFSGRIESIIYDVIEKAVTREIKRLKESLFQNDGPDDDPDGPSS